MEKGDRRVRVGWCSVRKTPTGHCWLWTWEEDTSWGMQVKLEEVRKQIPQWGLWKKHSAANIFISGLWRPDLDFCPLELWVKSFVLFKASMFVGNCYSTHRKLTQQARRRGEILLWLSAWEAREIGLRVFSREGSKQAEQINIPEL